MAIYGLNFNRTQIPDAAKAVLPSRVKLFECGHSVVCNAVGKLPRVGQKALCPVCICDSDMTDADADAKDVVFFQLQGVCESALECSLMQVQADNGHRKLHVEARYSEARTWFGVYCY